MLINQEELDELRNRMGTAKDSIESLDLIDRELSQIVGFGIGRLLAKGAKAQAIADLATSLGREFLR